MDKSDYQSLFIGAKRGSKRLSSSTASERNNALESIKGGLFSDREKIFKANLKDLDNAGREGLSSSLIKRLRFDQGKLDTVLKGIEDIIALDDPKGRILEKRELDHNLVLERISFPIGVIGMVFESRPDALVQIVSLCIKSGNGIVLKGGREALNTNKALYESIENSLDKSDIPSSAVMLLEGREEVSEMLKADGYIDLLIPRGSNEFVRYVMDNTHIPVIGHSSGVCMVYIDDEADLDKAVRVAVDSKTEYPSACNAAETIIVSDKLLSSFLPLLKAEFDKRNVIVHADERCILYIGSIELKESDYGNEYLDYECNVIAARDIDQAIEHINKYSSHHTDSIVTENRAKADRFISEVDSADVFVNASTRFADGYRYGLGAEVGISTGKIHSRGPVGLNGLMTYKWVIHGDGDIVEPYNKGDKFFTHKDIL